MQGSPEDAEECEEGELRSSEEWNHPAAHDLLTSLAANLAGVIGVAAAHVGIEGVATITLRPGGVTDCPKLLIRLKVLLEAHGCCVLDAGEDSASGTFKNFPMELWPRGATQNFFVCLFFSFCKKVGCSLLVKIDIIIFIKKSEV